MAKGLSTSNISVPQSDNKTKKEVVLYKQLLGFLFYIFYHPKVNQTLKSSPQIFLNLLNLLSILNYLEENTNIFQEKRLFSKISALFSNLYRKDLQIDIFDGKLSNQYIDEQISTLKIFLSNITLIPKNNFNHSFVEEDIDKILLNKYDFSALVYQSLVNDNSTVLKQQPKQELELPHDKDFKGSQPVLKSSSQEINDPYKRLTDIVFTPEARQIITDKFRNDPNFYPFATRPKLIIHLKRVISLTALLNIAWTIIFILFVATNSNLITFFYQCLNKSIFSISKSETVYSLIGVVFLAWIPVYIRCLFKFLIIPKQDKHKYNFPAISSFFSFLWGVMCLIIFYKFWLYFLGILDISSSNQIFLLSNSEKAFQIIFGVFFLLFYIFLLILLLIGIYKKPKINLQAIIEALDNPQNLNFDNNHINNFSNNQN